MHREPPEVVLKPLLTPRHRVMHATITNHRHLLLENGSNKAQAAATLGKAKLAETQEHILFITIVNVVSK